MSNDLNHVVRTEVVADLLELNREAMRLPTHFVDRKAALHAKMNELLTLLELVDE